MANVVLKNVRLSYAHLLAPQASLNEGGTPKYSVRLMIPKSDTENIALIQKALAETFEEGVKGKKWNGVRPTSYVRPTEDGDNPGEGKQPKPEFAGHWLLNPKSDAKPRVVDLKRTDITNPDDVYSGMYANVSISFFPYNFKGKYGIGVGLNNVQKTKDGEPFASRSRVEDDFEILDFDGGDALPF